MQIIYTCPECGGDLQEQILTSYPPIRKVVCHQCGWSYEYPRDDAVRIPFIYPVDDSYNKNGFFTASNCEHCGNNPANGGSGICHCILGSPQITC